MKPNYSIIAAALFACLLASRAEAQVSNRPFAFSGTSSGAGVGFGVPGSLGMSPAYKELTMERKLLGRSTDNSTFLRAPDGTLVNVNRRNSGAYPNAVAAPFLTSSSGAFGVTVGGFGYATAAGDYGSAVYVPPRSRVPIDSWIFQLNYMSDSL